MVGSVFCFSVLCLLFILWCWDKPYSLDMLNQRTDRQRKSTNGQWEKYCSWQVMCTEKSMECLFTSSAFDKTLLLFFFTLHHISVDTEINDITCSYSSAVPARAVLVGFFFLNLSVCCFSSVDQIISCPSCLNISQIFGGENSVSYYNILYIFQLPGVMHMKHMKTSRQSSQWQQQQQQITRYKYMSVDGPV